jgi:hypothetical protein
LETTPNHFGLSFGRRIGDASGVRRVFNTQDRAFLPFRALCMLALLALLCADLSTQFRPLGYLGGSSDDQRYLEIALRWLVHGPHAGTTHWALRHPLILAIVASFHVSSISIAALLLPARIAFDLLVTLSVVMMARHFGLRAAFCWLPLALFMPIIHRNATDCGLEMLELLFGAASAWVFVEACQRSQWWANALMVLSGACCAVAVLTRETSAVLLLVYGYAWVAGKADRRGALWFAAGFVPLIAWDNIWLWMQTGDPLYRLHVDQSHTHIYSNQLEGGIYAGRVLLNPDLASRWVPVGPVKLFWAIDPILNFFVGPDFGMIFLAWLILWAMPATRPSPRGAVARAMPWLLALAVSGYVLVTWIMTLRPQPRYFLFPVYAALLAVALLLAQDTGGRVARYIRSGVATLVLIAEVTVTLLTPDHQLRARLSVAWLQRHPMTAIHFADPEDAHGIAFPAILGGVDNQIRAGAPPIGGLRMRDAMRPPGWGSWQSVETLRAPLPFPYLGKHNVVLVERRIR